MNSSSSISSPIISFGVSTPFFDRDEVYSIANQGELKKVLSSDSGPRLILIDALLLKDTPIEDFFDLSPDSLWIVDGRQNEFQKIKWILGFPQILGELGSNEQANRQLLQRGTEKIFESVQEADLLKIVRSENLKLKAQVQSLTEDQTSNLQNASNKANLRMKALEAALIEILKSKTVGEVERALHKALVKVIPLDYARILFHQQSSLVDQTQNPQLVRIPLLISDSKSKGWLILGLAKKKPLSDKDLELLEEVAEIASLSINRILQLEASESLKQQWDATFDAISDPLCLVDERMQILRTNKAFSRSVGKSFSELIGENALKCFFKDNPEVWSTPPPMNLKLQIQSQSDNKSYSMIIHDLRFGIDDKNINLLLIKDVTEEMRLEKQIREKSKLVELGTIGSSIAHELNNPLAGMLSYLQLMLMDAPSETEFQKDLKEMESATLRCRDIVQSLLGFSRKQSAGAKLDVDLNALIAKAVQLVELKSRFRKVKIQIASALKNAPFKGDGASLVQAVTHILSNSLEAFEEKPPTKEAEFMAEINISLSEEKTQDQNFYQIRIKDNGPGIQEKHLPLVINPLFTTKSSGEHAGLGLTVAYSIFAEHEGSLEIESRPGQGVTAIISLPRPEFQASSRGIDTQI